MDKPLVNIVIGVFRVCRLILHLSYGLLLAIFFPHLNEDRQRRILKTWSRALLKILNVGLQIEGPQPTYRADSWLMVANHVSWLDIFILNAIQPAHFIAKSEIRSWPLIGWLCRRSGTLFIERTVRHAAEPINQRIMHLLKQGNCVGLFPEGTTTDGSQVGHFHSSLMQSAIDSEAILHPIALRYQNDDGRLSADVAFTGDTTLVQSIWKIVRRPHHNALVIFTPALFTANKHRRVLAHAARQAIAQELKTYASREPQPVDSFSFGVQFTPAVN